MTGTKSKTNYSMADFDDLSISTSLEVLLETILFVSPSALSASQLANLLHKKPKEIETALNSLDNYYKTGRGLRLQNNHGKYQITTSPEFSPLIQSVIGLDETATLSQAALEALSIIAYRQPITRPEVDEIRGVNSDGVIRNLMNKGLIHEVGRGDGVGRPILYGTTAEFLQYFGLLSLGDLPKFEVLQHDKLVEKKILKD
jgi:segregation and condensation protein B